MPSFSLDDITSGRYDWALFQNGPIQLFWRVEVLEQAISELAKFGYIIHDVDAGPWTSESDMHDAVSREFKFPDYYGRNLNALNDCLSDVAYYGYGSRPDTLGTAFVLRHFDKFAKLETKTAHVLLDCYARQARHGLLVGHRMICLVQSDDPNITFERVGSMAVMWNPAEWLASKRKRTRSHDEHH